MTINVKTLHEAHNAYSIQITIKICATGQTNYGAYTAQQSSVIKNNYCGIDFQSMYTFDSKSHSGICFIKLSKKQNCSRLNNYIIFSCQEFHNKFVDNTTGEEVNSDLIIEKERKKKEIKADDEWHSIKKFGSVPDTTIIYVMNFEFKVPPLQMSFNAIYDDTVFTDFELNGSDGSVRMHKAVAAAASPYFKTLFTGDWLETSSGIVKVSDTSVSILQYLKDFMYLGKVGWNEVAAEDLKQLLLLSSFYMMPDLELRCIEEMAARINTGSAYDLMKFAITENISQLVFKILEFVQRGFINIEEMKKSSK